MCCDLPVYLEKYFYKGNDAGITAFISLTGPNYMTINNDNDILFVLLGYDDKNQHVMFRNTDIDTWAEASIADTEDRIMFKLQYG